MEESEDGEFRPGGIGRNNVEFQSRDSHSDSMENSKNELEQENGKDEDNSFTNKKQRLSNNSTDGTNALQPQFQDVENGQLQFHEDHSRSRDFTLMRRRVTDEITVTVLERERRPKKDGSNYAYFLLLRENPKNELVEAKSFREYVNVNYEKLHKGKSYILKGNISEKPKDVQFIHRSKSELPWEYVFDTIEVFQKYNTDPAQEFYYGEATSIQELNSKISMEGFNYCLVKDVTLVSGKIRRYIGCKACQKSRPKHLGNGIFRCSSCKKEKYAKEFFSKFIMINEMVIKDSEGNFFEKPLVCFNNVTEKLLGMSSVKFKYDEEAQEEFQKLINSKMNMRLTYHLPTVKTSSENCYDVDDWMYVQVHDIIVNYIDVTSTSKPKREVQADATPFGEPISSSDSEEESAPIFDLTLFEKDIKINTDDAYTEPLCCLEKYSLTSNPTGCVLILNIFKYDKGGDRNGSEGDVEKLISLFTNLNFEVYDKPEEKLYFEQLTEKIESFKRKLIEKDISACAIIVMGHGRNEQLKLTDGKLININEHIFEPFSMEKFPEFTLKPKLFIVNACADLTQDGTNIDPFQFPIIENAYFCHSSIPGYPSYRDTKFGSVFINRYIAVLQLHANKMEYSEMMRVVQFEMGKDVKKFRHWKKHEAMTHCRIYGEEFRPFYFKIETFQPENENGNQEFQPIRPDHVDVGVGVSSNMQAAGDVVE